MSGLISSNFRKLQSGEVERVAAECAEAWKEPAIPSRQYDLAAEAELKAFRLHGTACAPFTALIKCLRHLPTKFLKSRPRLLDVGASGGYYSEVLQLAKCDFQYTGLDFSESFQLLAQMLYPGIDFQVGDARALPFKDDSFEIVLHGAVLMHCFEYRKAIQEAVRVAERYVIFHRTPVMLYGPTLYFEKYGYDCRMLEIHFGEDELMKLFESHELKIVWQENVFKDDAIAYRTYLLKKPSPGERE